MCYDCWNIQKYIPLPGLPSIKTILFACSSISAAPYERHDGKLKLMI